MATSTENVSENVHVITKLKCKFQEVSRDVYWIKQNMDGY